MLIDTFLKTIFCLSLSGGIGLVSWGDVSYYLDSKEDIHEEERIYDELGKEFYEQEIEVIVKEVEGKIEKIKKGCKDKIRITFPKYITRTKTLETGLKRDDSETQKLATRQTYSIMEKSWIEIFRDNLNDHDELINYSKIFKKACDIYSSKNENINLELGYVPHSYRLFGWTGLNHKLGFRITNDKFKHVLYGAIEGDYQTTNSKETNIDEALKVIN